MTYIPNASDDHKGPLHPNKNPPASDPAPDPAPGEQIIYFYPEALRRKPPDYGNPPEVPESDDFSYWDPFQIMYAVTGTADYWNTAPNDITRPTSLSQANQNFLAATSWFYDTAYLLQSLTYRLVGDGDGSNSWTGPAALVFAGNMHYLTSVVSEQYESIIDFPRGLYALDTATWDIYSALQNTGTNIRMIAEQWDLAPYDLKIKIGPGLLNPYGPTDDDKEYAERIRDIYRDRAADAMRPQIRTLDGVYKKFNAEVPQPPPFAPYDSTFFSKVYVPPPPPEEPESPPPPEIPELSDFPPPPELSLPPELSPPELSPLPEFSPPSMLSPPPPLSPFNPNGVTTPAGLAPNTLTPNTLAPNALSPNGSTLLTPQGLGPNGLTPGPGSIGMPGVLGPGGSISMPAPGSSAPGALGGRPGDLGPPGSRFGGPGQPGVPRGGPGIPGGGPAGAAPYGGMPFMPPPMSPGQGAGQQNKERERTTWLLEDEDVWGADAEVPPAVLGRLDAVAEGTSPPARRNPGPGTSGTDTTGGSDTAATGWW